MTIAKISLDCILNVHENSEINMIRDYVYVFHLYGKTRCVKKDLQIMYRGLQINSPHDVSMRILVISSP